MIIIILWIIIKSNVVDRMIDSIMNSIICGDCADKLKEIDDESIDLILTDPPFHTTFLDFDESKNNNYDEIYGELKRVLKYNGWFFCFGTIPMLADIIKNDRWRLKFNYAWVKPFGAPATFNTIHPLIKHELIGAYCKPELEKVTELYFDKVALESKGTPYVRKMSSTDKRTEFEIKNKRRPDTKDGKIKDFVVKNNGKRTGTSILEFPHKPCMPKNERTEHPTQKPEGLLRSIIEGYCLQGGIVLDPFAGSGSTLLSAMKTGRRFIGIEKNKEYADVIQERLDRWKGHQEELKSQEEIAKYFSD